MRKVISSAILLACVLLALATEAYSSTISWSVSTSGQDATACSLSGSGPAMESCSSAGDRNNSVTAMVTVNDDSFTLDVVSFQAASGEASASVTHDDFYSVPVNGPVSALLTLTCQTLVVAPSPHFSLGSTNVSPPVESVFQGASQGSGTCGPSQIALIPPFFLVSLSATNNLVELQTEIDATAGAVDYSSGAFVQLTVDGFQDANGNPITATLVTPEPGTSGTVGLALFMVAAISQRKRGFAVIRSR